MIAAADAPPSAVRGQMSESAPFIRDSGYTRQALLRRKEPTGWDGIEKSFIELGKVGFVLFEHTLPRARANLLFGTVAALNRRIP